MRVKISNEEIYNKLCLIEKKMTVAYWTSCTSLTLSLMLIGGLIFT
ncbi:MAG: hypothetical protein PHS54_02925 [Clostridia bacterium]|nr:hypothetical protein [Clostridia bacterium]